MEDLPNWTLSEEDRLKSFKYWPFKRGPCCPEKMAEAGFYSIGSKAEPDLAKCYVCFKELDGWEEDDDPWYEHKKHASACPFVLLEKKPSDLTVKDVLNLELERLVKNNMLLCEKKVNILKEVRDAIVQERDKFTGVGEKENRKKKNTRTAAKRSSRKVNS